MKKTTTILILIIFTLNLTAQNKSNFADSIKIDNLTTELNDINYRLDKHHSQYKKGLKVFLIGNIVGVGISGLLYVNQAVNVNNPKLPITFSILGGITSLIGVGIMIDSDKWFVKSKNQKIATFYYQGKKYQGEILRTDTENKKYIVKTLYNGKEVEVQINFSDIVD